jgi:hypothetical protein
MLPEGRVFSASDLDLIEIFFEDVDERLKTTTAGPIEGLLGAAYRKVVATYRRRIQDVSNVRRVVNIVSANSFP